MSVDRSDAADARRLRWLLSGHGYFMEENYLCGHEGWADEREQDHAREVIDKAMSGKG